MIATVDVAQWGLPVGMIVMLTLYQLYFRDHGWVAWIIIAVYVLTLPLFVVATLGALLDEEYLFFVPLFVGTALWALLVWTVLSGLRK